MLFVHGVDYDRVYALLITAGYRHRTRKALIEDALYTGPFRDPRSPDQKQESRILERIRR